jgi:multimeric flavodoxin WrbA
MNINDMIYTGGIPMKTLVFFGSARKNGNTKALLNVFVENIEGEIEIIDSYRSNISPCIDCRYCWKERACSIKDGMQDIYEKIDNADNIVFASPLYFNNVPGPLKNIIDRMQLYWAETVRDESYNLKEKNAVFLICGGAPKYENQFLSIELVLNGVIKDLNAKNLIGKVYVSSTDKKPVDKNENVINKTRKIAKKINKQ